MKDRDGNGTSGGLERARVPFAPYSRFLYLLALGWSVTAAGSLTVNLKHHSEQAESLTVQTARAILQKDMLYREWSLLHGNVYVPKSGQPQPFSTPPAGEERDIRTPSGQELTLLNPALVSRQIFKSQEESTGVRGNLVSLNPVNKGNLPDPWERQALESFNSGQIEASAVETQGRERYFRLMRPLILERACLRCHEERGYQLGMIRGGISVTVPMSRFVTRGENERLILAHLCLWLVGMTGLVLGGKNLEHHSRKRWRAEEENRTALKEKEALLQEIHHRVKNNLQVISSLLQLQINDIKDPQSLAVFQESQLRIRSMALIHEKLYESDSLAQIDLAEYLRDLVQLLFSTYAHDPSRVLLVLDLTPTFVSIDAAIPLGLIANELITNSLKFAFPSGRNGVIRVESKPLPDHEFQFRVADDGVGFPDGLVIEQAASLGLRLVRMLTGQLDGEGTWGKVAVGTSFSLRFRDKRTEIAPAREIPAATVGSTTRWQPDPRELPAQVKGAGCE
jgi:two-component sensor histidine kinase